MNQDQAETFRMSELAELELDDDTPGDRDLCDFPFIPGMDETPDLGL